MFSLKTSLATARRFAPLTVALAVLPSCYLFCPYNADQFVETQIRAECHFWFSCCTAGEHELALTRNPEFADMNRFRDEGSCVQERLEEGSVVNEALRAVTQAEQAGRFKFDVAQFQICQQPLIDALNTCNADFVIGDARPLEVAPECEGVPGVGLVGDQKDCFFDFECAVAGSDCLSPGVLEPFDPDEEPEEPDEELISQPKICIAPIKKGDSCELDPDLPELPATCEPGTICFTQSDGDQECEEPHQQGEDCNFDGDCDVGLYCDPNAGEPECAELKGEGKDCTAENECDIGLFCDLVDANPECTANLPVNVEICNGVNGTPDPTYPAKSNFN